jgi:hypothetical protein
MYKIGQKLICIDAGWHDINNNPVDGPNKGEIITFDGIHKIYNGMPMIYLAEYDSKTRTTNRDNFNSSAFVPVRGQSAIKELTRNFSATIETYDIPNIKIPEIA